MIPLIIFVVAIVVWVVVGNIVDWMYPPYTMRVVG